VACDGEANIVFEWPIGNAIMAVDFDELEKTTDVDGGQTSVHELNRTPPPERGGQVRWMSMS
jgi:hypothetical protein